MELISEPAAPPAAGTAAASGPSMSADEAQEATARMFRSVRAGRRWVRGRTGAAAEAPACVLMKAGNDEAPVFMMPGAPGSILQMAPLAEALAVPMPVYVLKPRGLEEGESPCETVAEMAQYNIAMMRKLRPHGPYPLVGYSAGGLVALEMARQLTAAGDPPPIVILLDTYPSRKTWPIVCHLEIFARHARQALASLLRCSPGQAVREIARRCRSLAGYLAESGVGLLPVPEVVPEGWSAASRRVHVAAYKAGEAYRPSRYTGKVIVVRPQQVQSLYPKATARVWRRFLGPIDLRYVPGEHLDMLETAGAAIAAEIGDALTAAARGALPQP